MGTVDWTLAFNYGETTVSSIAPTPPQLLASYPVLPVTPGEVAVPQHLYDQTAISLLTMASPKEKLGLGALWTYGDFVVNLRETIYGPTKQLVSRNGGGYYTEEVSTAGITDLEIDYSFTDMIGLAIGANNLFDQNPETVKALNATQLEDGSNVVGAPLGISPYGINGGFYYGRVTFKF